MNKNESIAIRMNERLRLTQVLLDNIKPRQEELRKLLAEVNRHWGYEDRLYRFYHQSLKVFHLQEETKKIIAALAEIAPERQPFCELFREVTQTGLDREFKLEDNEHWVESTASILQAFFHARYFLEMAVKYAAELTEPPQVMPSGWAALLCLYEIR